jgi:hypothetical protein
MNTVKCAWCGQVLPLTHKGRPKQHKNGAHTCPGSGQLKAVHERLRAANEKAHSKG